MISRRWLALILSVMLILTSASSGYSQSSSRSTLITKCEQAAAEVEKGRQYITELEAQLADEVKAHGEATAEANELREAIAALKKANAERVKAIAKLQSQLNKEKASKRFWRKVALVTSALLAAGTAAVVLRR